VRVERVVEAGDARLDDYRELRDPERRLARGQFVAETREVVAALVRGGRYPVESVLLTEASLAALGGAVEGLPAGTPVYVASHAVIQAVVGFQFHRGCVAIGRRETEPSLSEVLAAGPRLVVLCEDLVNPDNVGGVFRNALAFGADAVLLSSRCCDPLYRKVVRVSMGAVLRVPFARVADWGAGIVRLREAGFGVLALTTSGGVDVGELAALPERVAVIVGAEGEGLSAASREAASMAVTIPMAAGVDSLNVATAAGIVLWRVRGRHRRTR
jgi:tRNA G18 (ribose-2'-O)-methylase SpoU